MRRSVTEKLTDADRRRFEELFLPYLDTAYNLARWIIQDDQDSRDVVQEAYLRAFKAFPQFRDGNSRAWLLTIVRNTAYNRLNRRTKDEKIIPYDEEKHADIIPMTSAEDDLAAEERQQFLKHALENLPPEYREVIVLYELEGLSYKELALALAVPVGTVMSRLSRARRRLQENTKYGT